VEVGGDGRYNITLYGNNIFQIKLGETYNPLLIYGGTKRDMPYFVDVTSLLPPQVYTVDSIIMQRLK
jgi:hypothetical protein